MTVAELISQLEKIENKDLQVRCYDHFVNIPIRNVKVVNTYGGITDEFVNVY